MQIALMVHVPPPPTTQDRRNALNNKRLAACLRPIIAVLTFALTALGGTPVLAQTTHPKVSLALTSTSISESGTSNVTTVTTTLDKTSSVATTVTVSVAPVSPAVAGDFTLSSATTLTIAAGSTTSTGTVTIRAAVNNSTDAPDKTFTVSGTAANSVGHRKPGRCDADDHRR